MLNARDDYQQALKRIEALEKEKEVKQPSAGAGGSQALTKGQLRRKPKEKTVQQSDSWADRSRSVILETEKNTNDDSTEFEDDFNKRHDTDIDRQPSSSKALQARRTSRARSTQKLSKKTETKTKRRLLHPAVG